MNKRKTKKKFEFFFDLGNWNQTHNDDYMFFTCFVFRFSIFFHLFRSCLINQSLFSMSIFRCCLMLVCCCHTVSRICCCCCFWFEIIIQKKKQQKTKQKVIKWWRIRKCFSIDFWVCVCVEIEKFTAKLTPFFWLIFFGSIDFDFNGWNEWNFWNFWIKTHDTLSDSCHSH